MNKKNKLTALITLVASVILAGEPEIHANTTFEEAVVASGWTIPELLAALDLMEARYNRDNSTRAGRQAWHGRVVHESIDTNTLTKVSIYEDGYVFADPAKVTTPAQSAKAELRQLAVQTNGVPARLAAARLRQQQTANTISNVTIQIKAGDN